MNHWLILGLIVLAVLALWNARATRETVSARDLRIIDGDTVWLVDGNGHVLEKMRLAEIDAPETRGFKGFFQKRSGLASKNALAQIIARADRIEIVRQGADKYGRTLVKLYDRNSSRPEIGKQLARAGYARRWS